MPVTVSKLAIAPVKGMRLQRTGEVQLDRHGVTGDREFLIIGHDSKLVQSSEAPTLLQVQPAWDRVTNLLILNFPTGEVVEDKPEPGVATTTRTYNGREIPGWIIPGPLSSSLSAYLGRPVHLFKRAAEQFGTDDQPVSLMSEASLQALGQELNAAALDSRRFRMTISITGTAAWAEHGWSGQEVRIGEVSLRIIAPVPRCVITTRNPESGVTDARVLHALARLRGKDDVTFGVWCEVFGPGRVHVGDVVTPPPGRLTA